MANLPTTDTIISHCPIRGVLAHICSKWSMLVIYTMRGNAPMRFSSLHKSIPDISQKVLTSTLRSLETDGFLTRTVYAEVPPRVEYSLTERARSFLPLMENLVTWAMSNMGDILKERSRH